ncbi:MAG: hypothetical protein LPK19_08260 [Hymenobacteraceae bacterium]|nr:hypothetical protein [Hymenobacteraceae bacterium]MDX5396207.1 hypothetical protein [Hymenobacteraceae bacterium]MDX5512270.1 hypothetical protein [Hymenobacteraceae bacterium]
MMRFKFLIVGWSLLLLSSCQPATEKQTTVNAVLGDESFVEAFGKIPGDQVPDKLRIQVHLAFVEQLLRQKNCSHLPQRMQVKRKHLLNLLRDYRLSGTFPANFDFPGERKPCFIDKNGNICAVGYLIEKTDGRALAEKINSHYQYSYLPEIKMPELLAWVEQSGLTATECAMIQPAYGAPPVYSYNYISPEYGVTSAVLGGVNVSFSAVNAVQAVKGTDNKIVPIAGLVTGAGSVLLGALNFENEQYGFMYPQTNESKKALSMLNIGLGTTTIVLSAWNLIEAKPKKSNSMSWNMDSYPAGQNQMGVGVSISKKL